MLNVVNMYPYWCLHLTQNLRSQVVHFEISGANQSFVYLGIILRLGTIFSERCPDNTAGFTDG